MDRNYSIYRVTSPSGRAYVGLTRQTVKQRWSNHRRCAATGQNHPLYCAIRKYGSEAFVVETLDTGLTEQEAVAKEVQRIAEQVNPYNITKGGEAHPYESSQVFWNRMRADPVAFAGYRAKLIAAQAARVVSPEAAKRQRDGVSKWMVDNPRLMWKNAYRGLRLARKVNGTKPEPAPKPLKEVLLAKHKGVFLSRSRGVTQVWANRTAEQINAIGATIADTLTKRYATDAEMKAKNESQLETARKNIDRVFQKAQAAKGVALFWQKLKADPIAYAAHVSVRRETLMKTLEKKALCEPTTL